MHCLMLGPCHNHHRVDMYNCGCLLQGMSGWGTFGLAEAAGAEGASLGVSPAPWSVGYMTETDEWLRLQATNLLVAPSKHQQNKTATKSSDAYKILILPHTSIHCWHLHEVLPCRAPVPKKRPSGHGEDPTGLPARDEQPSPTRSTNILLMWLKFWFVTQPSQGTLRDQCPKPSTTLSAP